MTLPQRNTALARPTNFYYLMCKLDRAQYRFIIKNGGVKMVKSKVVAWFFVILWAIVLYLTFTNKMMLAMDLMAIGMFLDAVKCLIKS